MKVVDYLVVGQGLAGSLIAHFLLKADKTIYVLNHETPHAASNVAAGIINPVTGRRFVKSWRVDELIPFAKETYDAFEQQLGNTFFTPRNILRTLYDVKDENNWLNRSGTAGYEKYILDNSDLANYNDHIKKDFGYGEVMGGGQVNVPLLVQHYRNWLVSKDSYQATSFDYDQITIEAEKIKYKNIVAQKIIFCEGNWGKHNPYFSYLPFRGAKGEALIVKIADAHFSKLLKRRVFIVPLGNDHYWIGSTAQNQYDNERPSGEGKSRLIERLDTFLKLPYEIVAHKSAIRPTVKDRRPFLGLHPDYPQLAIFNGLGTKGASLGPFFAKQMADFLVFNQPIDDSVDIRRF